MFLNSQMHELLLILDQAKIKTDSEWVSLDVIAHIPTTIRGYALARDYMYRQGSRMNGLYKIAPKGRTMLAKNAEANLGVIDQLEQGYVPVGDEPPSEVETGVITSLINPPLEIIKGIDVIPGFVPASPGSPPPPEKKQRCADSARRDRRARTGVRPGHRHPGRTYAGSRRPGRGADQDQPAKGAFA